MHLSFPFPLRRVAGRWRTPLAWFAGLLLTAPAEAADWRLELEGNWQPQLQAPAQQTGASAALEFELHPYAREEHGSSTLDLVLFGRHDEREPERSHADVREFIFTFALGDFELRAGAGRVFWGVTEGANLVDIVNQEDWLEDIDGEDKLGQPLLAAAWTGDLGIWRAYLLPHFRARKYPGPESFPVGIPIDEDSARYESSRARQHVDLALRWKHFFGPLDIALSAFRGTAREPRLVPCAREGSGRPGTEDGPNCDLEAAFPEPGPLETTLAGLTALLGLGPSADEQEQAFIEAALADIDLVPHYEQIEQLGAELQYIRGGWAWKFEGRRRERLGEVEHALAAGFEYTRAAPFGWPADFGYLLEYLYDDRREGNFVAPLNNDLLLGFRALVSDVAGTQLLAGIIQDLDDRGRIYSVEASRRFGGNLRGALEWRAYSDFAPDDPLAFLNRADRLRLSLSRFF